MGNRWFITGDALTSGSQHIVVTVPKSQANWLLSVFMAAVELMGDPDAWITGGETTPDEAAQIFETIFDNLRFELMDIGDIKFSAANAVLPSNWLLCDGSFYAQSTYPDLYAAIGTTYNPTPPPGQFAVPDLRGRVIAGLNGSSGRLPSWGDTDGGTGGESTHTLVVAEMPSHTHSDVGHSHSIPSFLLTGTAVPPPLDAGTQIPLSLTQTGLSSASLTNTGGNSAHNNVQPTMTLTPYILALL